MLHETIKQEETKPEDLLVCSNSIQEQNGDHNPITAQSRYSAYLPLVSKLKNTMVIDETSKHLYSVQLNNTYEKDNFTITTDHCYARPWNWRPETNFLRPTKLLFESRQSTVKSRSSNPLISANSFDEEIDVESVPEIHSHDWSKAKSSMEECEKYAFTSRTDKGEDEWEKSISKITWSPAQYRVFNSMVNILNNFNLAKLAFTDSNSEPILRRTVIDKAVQRVRRLLATISWDPKITQWLHQLLIDNLGPLYLSYYLDILQTLKAKLPHFVEKMMYGPNSSLRVGALNNTNLNPLLERVWNPLPNLNQDKPKKLPGNPILIVVPSAPTSSSKSMQKWIKLLSSLATVITVPINFGSAGHRMTLTTCLDQLFSVTRGTIQDLKADQSGRNIVLIGFQAGAALALQVARVEPVMCVVTIGFSLLTAEGRRGEPDDSLLELQCPVLFIIGQRSNVSSQEDMEDLRERMKVETGLVVVGAADDYLRISKKKKRLGRITQSIVDRNIVDEIGEFVSSVILSPYPPQIRQSPTQVNPEPAVKKGKLERTRYNSNASSLDSEPPSPTPPRITRPVGRPPGSKSKIRLETKWAQQMAQGNNNLPLTSPSPNPSPPPPYPTIPTPDTSSTDSSSQPDRHAPDSATPVKKIKTLKPFSSTTVYEKSGLILQGKTTPNSSARMQAYGLNRSVQDGNLSTLLQGGIKTIPPTPKATTNSGIKVLENVTLTGSAAAKLIHNRNIDLSKITLINSVKTNSTASNVMLLPDGKIRTVQGSNIKTPSSSPILVPLSPQRGLQRQNRNKIITAKRQLIGHRTPRAVKKPPVYVPSSTIHTNLPPPTNLTTQDIMDLPIIFADDNQLLEPTNPPTESPSNEAISSSPQVTKVISSIPATKFMLINKQANQGNLILTSANVKKTNLIPFHKPPPKYTKIILSTKKPVTEEKINQPLQSFSPEITVRKISAPKQKATEDPPVELVDLENEIKATAVPKPNMPSDKNVTLVQKNASGNYELVQMKQEASSSTTVKKTINLKYDMLSPNAALQKMPCSNVPEQPKFNIGGLKRPLSDTGTVDDDPDYVPPKSIKIE